MQNMLVAPRTRFSLNTMLYLPSIAKRRARPRPVPAVALNGGKINSPPSRLAEGGFAACNSALVPPNHILLPTTRSF